MLIYITLVQTPNSLVMLEIMIQYIIHWEVKSKTKWQQKNAISWVSVFPAIKQVLYPWSLPYLRFTPVYSSDCFMPSQWLPRSYDVMSRCTRATCNKHQLSPLVTGLNDPHSMCLTGSKMTTNAPPTPPPIPSFIPLYQKKCFYIVNWCWREQSQEREKKGSKSSCIKGKGQAEMLIPSERGQGHELER